MLTTYLTAVQRLLGTGSAQNLYTDAQLTSYINTARGQIAAEGQCIRAVPPTSGPITAITVLSAGTGYTTAQVIIPAPDSPSGSGPFPAGQQASATAAFTGGGITSVTLLSTGAGYFSTTALISGNGTGAKLLAVVSGINQTVINQETYPFSGVNPLVNTSGAGINSVYMVRSISMIWGTFRYTLMHYSFSKYQAFARTYTAGYTYIPSVFCQFQQGVNGSVMVYPIPNQAYQMEWDCCCLPNDLATDTDPEAIPYPWTDAVRFLAAYYAFSGAQRFTDADRMWQEYEKYMKRARQMSQPMGTVNRYGRAG